MSRMMLRIGSVTTRWNAFASRKSCFAVSGSTVPCPTIRARSANPPHIPHRPGSFPHRALRRATGMVTKILVCTAVGVPVPRSHPVSRSARSWSRVRHSAPGLLGVFGGAGEAAFDRERVDGGQVGGQPRHAVPGVLDDHPPVPQRVGVPRGSGPGGRGGPAGCAGGAETRRVCSRSPIPRSRRPRSGGPPPRRPAPPGRRRPHGEPGQAGHGRLDQRERGEPVQRAPPQPWQLGARGIGGVCHVPDLVLGDLQAAAPRRTAPPAPRSAPQLPGDFGEDVRVPAREADRVQDPGGASGRAAMCFHLIGEQPIQHPGHHRSGSVHGGGSSSSNSGSAEKFVIPRH